MRYYYIITSGSLNGNVDYCNVVIMDETLYKPARTWFAESWLPASHEHMLSRMVWGERFEDFTVFEDLLFNLKDKSLISLLAYQQTKFRNRPGSREPQRHRCGVVFLWAGRVALSNTGVNTSLRCWQEGCGMVEGNFSSRCTGSQALRSFLALTLPEIRHKGVDWHCKALVCFWWKEFSCCEMFTRCWCN